MSEELKREEPIDPYYAKYTKQINVTVSEELYKKFKATTALAGVSMTAVLTDCIIRYNDKPNHEDK